MLLGLSYALNMYLQNDLKSAATFVVWTMNNRAGIERPRESSRLLTGRFLSSRLFGRPSIKNPVLLIVQIIILTAPLIFELDQLNFFDCFQSLSYCWLNSERGKGNDKSHFPEKSVKYKMKWFK